MTTEQETVYSYSRADALEDGVLVSLMQGEMLDVCKQHYKYPIACTASVYNLIEKSVKNEDYCTDYAGIVHDILYMSRVYGREAKGSTVYFPVIIVGAGRRRNFQMKLVVHPGDNMEPVITIMMGDED